MRARLAVLLLLLVGRGVRAGEPERDDARRLTTIAHLERRLERADAEEHTTWLLALAALQAEEGRAWAGRDPERSEMWLRRALAAYAAVPDDDPRADEATFLRAGLLGELGDPDAANVAHTALVKRWPAGTFATDAYAAIGQYWFERNNAYKALLAYQRAAAAGPGHPAWPRASLQYAWCLYNVGQYEDAIATMRAVVEEPAGQALRDEALAALVRFYADAGVEEEAVGWFDGLGRPDLAVATLERTAQMRVEQGKFDAAIQVFQRIQARDPLAPAAGRAQVGIVDALRKLGRKDDLHDATMRLVEEYGPESAWGRANAADPVGAEVRAAGEERLRKLAEGWQGMGCGF